MMVKNVYCPCKIVKHLAFDKKKKKRGIFEPKATKGYRSMPFCG